MKNSITGKELSIIVNSACRTSRIIERKRRHAPSMQALPSLTELLVKVSHKYPSRPTRINSVII